MKSIEERYQELKSAAQTIDENSISNTEIIFEEDDLIVVIKITERAHSTYYSYTSSIHWTDEALYISKEDIHDTPSIGYGSGGTINANAAKVAKAMKEIFNHAETMAEKLTD